ncbi:MAG: hypothetical protein JXB10_08960 [Pirellulales bacterium]|nr:hypothetical protein [Pirellulales bacterium]
MKLTITLLGGMSLFFSVFISGYFSGSAWAAIPADNTLVNSNDISAPIDGLATPKSPESSSSSPVVKTNPWDESVNNTWNTDRGLESEETTPRIGNSLIEKGHAQAQAAAAEQLRRGLQWGGGILAGLCLLAGGGYVWWRRSYGICMRTNQTARMLIFPTAYSVPPEPPVPDAVAQPVPGAGREIRPAA